MFFYKLSINLILFLATVSFVLGTEEDALGALIRSHSKKPSVSVPATASISTTPSPATDKDSGSKTVFPDLEDPFNFPEARISSPASSKSTPSAGNLPLSTSGYTPSSRTKTSTHVTISIRSTNKSSEDEYKSSSLSPKRGGPSVFQQTGGSIAFMSGRTPSKKITASSKKEEKK